MTKRRYRFGDQYIVNQIRLKQAVYVLYFESNQIGIHVRGAQPLLGNL